MKVQRPRLAQLLGHRSQIILPVDIILIIAAEINKDQGVTVAQERRGGVIEIIIRVEAVALGVSILELIEFWRIPSCVCIVNHLHSSGLKTDHLLA